MHSSTAITVLGVRPNVASPDKTNAAPHEQEEEPIAGDHGRRAGMAETLVVSPDKTNVAPQEQAEDPIAVNHGRRGTAETLAICLPQNRQPRSFQVRAVTHLLESGETVVVAAPTPRAAANPRLSAELPL